MSTIRPNKSIIDSIDDLLNLGNNNNADRNTVRPNTNNSTARPVNAQSVNKATNGTVRPSTNNSTVRPANFRSVNKAANGTVRPSTNNSTVRPTDSRSASNVANGTVRPNANNSMPNVSGTIKPQQSNNPNSNLIPDGNGILPDSYVPKKSYIINGKEYKVLQILSLTSGEAQVFLVEDPSGDKLVLKLYKKDIFPNGDILDKVISVNSASILFKEDSHGSYEDRYYELMKYYDGETLENVDVRKNEAVISKYIGKMVSAIDLCHHLGFIHRDVKPSNFIFENQDKDNILLGDFGIAVECDANGKCISDMARTKIYAAPEVYLNTGDGKASFSTKSDYYSLGIVIIFLWMGKDEFNHFEKENELQLATMKTYGNLPIPSSMPPRLFSLVRALIAPIPSERAGFKEVEAWLKGEDPFGSKYATTTGIETKSSFRIVFNGESGEIATSPEELARIMFANKSLATAYLYKGKISQWLADNGRPEIAVQMDRIKEDLYPRDTAAGLEAACYFLNPAMPFIDIYGNNCYTSSDIAKSILNDLDGYRQQIIDNPNCRLLTFLQTHGLEATVSDFRKEFTKDNRLGLLYLVYRLDASQPWIMTTTNGQTVALNACDEILKWVRGNNTSPQSLSDLVSNAFLKWTEHRNKLVAAAILPLIGHQGDPNYSYGVLYRLNPKVGLFLNLDEKAPDYIYTIPQFASLINICLMNVINENDPNATNSRFLSILRDTAQGTPTDLYHFLASRRDASGQEIKWMNYCLDLRSADNTKKAGPYNETIAMFKLIKGWGGKASYTFKSGKTISDPKELASVSAADLLDAKSKPLRPLEAWLTVFFQEDPMLDKSAKYTYEKKTSAYVNFISSHGFNSPEIKRYSDSRQTVESRAIRLQSTLDTIKKNRLLIAVTALLPLGIAALLLAFMWRPDFGSLEFTTVFQPIAVILTIYFCFADGFAGKVIGEAIFGCLVAAAITAIIVWLSSIAAAITPYAAAAMAVGLGLYFYNKCIASDLKEDENDDLLNPTFEHLELEPLYEAYRPNPNGFDSSIGDRTADYQTELNDIKKTMWMKAMPVGIITVLGILYFLIFTPSSGDTQISDSTYSGQYSNQTVPDFSNGLSGTWEGTINGNKFQVEFKETDNPETFEFTMLSHYDLSKQLTFFGTFDPATKVLEVKKCQIQTQSSDFKANIAASGTLHLNDNTISGEIEIANPNNESTTITTPFNVYYVSK